MQLSPVSQPSLSIHLLRLLELNCSALPCRSYLSSFFFVLKRLPLGKRTGSWEVTPTETISEWKQIMVKIIL